MDESEGSFIIIYTIGNGYTCGCCRNESEHLDFFSTEAEVRARYDDLEARRKKGDDIRVNYVWKVEDVLK